MRIKTTPVQLQLLSNNIKMGRQLFLTAILLLHHSIAVESTGIMGDNIHRRHLSSSLLNHFFTVSKPTVDECWTDMQTLVPTGEEHPVIGCDFTVPKNYNCTADIQLGPCEYYNEPVCGEIDDNDSCLGPFITTGSMTSIAYPDFHPNEINSEEFIHTYCARADVYQYEIDNEGLGRQTHVTHAKRNIVVTFTGRGSVNPDTDEEAELFVDIENEPLEYRTDEANAALIGSIFGISVVVVLISIFIIENKRRKGQRSKVHHSTIIVDDNVSEETGAPAKEFEIV